MPFTKEQWEEWKKKNPREWEERRRKISESKKGRQMSERHRKAISKSMKGRKKSTEQRRKISESLKRTKSMQKGGKLHHFSLEKIKLPELPKIRLDKSEFPEVDLKKVRLPKFPVKEVRSRAPKTGFPGHPRNMVILASLMIIILAISFGVTNLGFVAQKSDLIKQYEGFKDITIGSSIEKVTTTVVFGDVRHPTCEEGILVYAEGEIVPFNIIESRFDENGLCREALIEFDNFIYQPPQDVQILFTEPTPEEGSTVTTASAQVNVVISESVKFGLLGITKDGITTNEPMAGGGDSWSYTLTDLVDGNYTLRVYVTDIFDNVFVSKERSFRANISAFAQQPANETQNTTVPEGNATQPANDTNISLPEANITSPGNGTNMTLPENGTNITSPGNGTNITSSENETNISSPGNTTSGENVTENHTDNSTDNITYAELEGSFPTGKAIGERTITYTVLYGKLPRVPIEVSFMPPTPEDMSVIPNDHIFVNITTNVNASNALLEYTMGNDTSSIPMTGYERNWFYNLTGLQTDIAIYYKVILNDTEGKVTVSDTRTVTVSGELIDEDLVELIQGEAEVGRAVKWTRKVKLVNRKGMTRNVKLDDINGDIPSDARRINIKEVDRDVVSDSILKTAVAPARNIESLRRGISVEPNKVKEIDIEFETDPPEKRESFPEQTDKYWRKRISVTSNSSLEYTNVKVSTSIISSMRQQLRLYHMINGQKVEVTKDHRYDFQGIDTNFDGKIDEVQWTVPHLSDQDFEVESDLTIINVQSYPEVGGNWTVEFTTTGTDDLWIRAVDGTTWSDSNYDNDLKFLEVRCGSQALSYTWIEENSSVFISNYSCSQTGYETSAVNTRGKHTLEFRYGDNTEYAHNQAGDQQWTHALRNYESNVTTDNTGPLTNNTIWWWNTRETQVLGGATISNGTAFFSTYYGGSFAYENTTFAVDERTGAMKWYYRHKGGNYTQFAGAPTYYNGTVYVARIPLKLQQSTGAGSVVALNATNGDVIWIWENNSVGGIQYPVAAVNGKIYLGTWETVDNTGDTYFFILNSNNGTPICSWKGTLGGKGYSTYWTVDTTNDVAFSYITDDGTSPDLVKLGASNCSLLDSRVISGGYGQSRSAMIMDGSHVYGLWSQGTASGGVLYNLTMSTLNTADSTSAFGASIWARVAGVYGPDNDVFVITEGNDGQVRKYNKTLDLWYTIDMPGNPQTDSDVSSALSIANGVAYFGCWRSCNTTYAYNASTSTATKIWQYNTSDSKEYGTPLEGAGRGAMPVVDGILLASSTSGVIAFRNNSAPTHTTPIINASTENHTVDDNITCWNQSTADSDGDPVRNVYHFTYDGASYETLILPFNDRSMDANLTKDYSGNCKVMPGDPGVSDSNEPLFAEGKYGGAFYFDGSNDHLNVSCHGSASLKTAITTEAWIYPYDYTSGSDTVSDIITKRLSYYMVIRSNGTISTYMYGTGQAWLTANSVLPLKKWTHVASVYNGTHKMIYINGTLENTQAFAGPITTSQYNVHIGHADGGILSGRYFNGTIDEVRIYPRALSQAEINDHANGIYNVVQSSETNKNEIWRCLVTPNDGIEDGAIRQSKRLLINGLPNISQISIMPLAPKTSDNITCDATVVDPDDSINKRVVYRWLYNNSNEFNALILPFDNNTNITGMNVKDYSGNAYTGVLSPKLQMGTINPFGAYALYRTNWTTVNLARNYSDPVVIVGTLSYAGTDESVLRIANVTRNSFQVRLQESERRDDDAHSSEPYFVYLVMEKTTHGRINGTAYEANDYWTASTTGRRVSDSRWDQLVLNKSSDWELLEHPTVLSSVNTYYDQHYVTTRQKLWDGNLKDYFNISLVEDEKSTEPHGRERIGYFIIQGGTGGETNPNIFWFRNDNGQIGQGIVNATSNTYPVDQNWLTIDWEIWGGGATTIKTPFLAKTTSARNLDPYTLRTQNLGVESVEVFGQEDAVYDAEQSFSEMNTAEDINYYIANTTNIGPPAWVPDGAIGGAYKFDGYNDYISITPDEGELDRLNFTANFTIEAWVKVDTVITDNDLTNRDVIISKTDGSTVNYEIYQANSKFGARMKNSSGTTYTTESSNIQADKWYHVAMRFKKHDGQDYLDIIVNGTSTGIGLSSVDNDVDVSGQPLVIGATIEDGDDPAAEYNNLFNGTIDEVRLYNRSLSDAQIAAHVNANYSYIDSAETRDGDNWTCYATPTDQYQDGATRSTSTVNTVFIEAINVTTDPLQPYVTDSIECLFNISYFGNESLYANVTWYNGTESITTYDETEINCTPNQWCYSPTPLPESTARKGENWTCEATAYIATGHSLAQNTSFVVLNSPPEWNPPPPDQYVEVDTEFRYDMNATDADNDTLTYWINDTSFTINTSTGVINRTYSTYGNYSVLVNVTDGTNNTLAVFNIYVRNASGQLCTQNTDCGTQYCRHDWDWELDKKMCAETSTYCVRDNSTGSFANITSEALFPTDATDPDNETYSGEPFMKCREGHWSEEPYSITNTTYHEIEFTTSANNTTIYVNVPRSASIINATMESSGYMSTEWIGPVIVNDNTSNGQYNSVIAKAGTTLFMAWSDERNWSGSGTTENDIYFSKSTDGGLSWTPSVKVNSIPRDHDMRWPVIYAVNTSLIYIAYQSSGTGQDGVYLANSTDGGSTWGNEELTVSSYLGWSQYLCIDYFNDKPVVVMGPGGLYVSNRTASGWGNPVFLANSYGQHNAFGCASNSKYFFVVGSKTDNNTLFLWNTSDLSTYTETPITSTSGEIFRYPRMDNNSDTIYLAIINNTYDDALYNEYGHYDRFLIINTTDHGTTWSDFKSIGTLEKGVTKTWPELHIEGSRFLIPYRSADEDRYLDSNDTGVTWEEKIIGKNFSSVFKISSQFLSKCVPYSADDVICAGTYADADGNGVAVARYQVPMYPTDPLVDVGNDGIDWSHAGTFTETDSPENITFASSLTNVISACSCTGCTVVGNNCSVPIKVGSGSKGKIVIDNMLVTYDTAPPAITFVSPTPANGSRQTGNSVTLNATVVDDTSDIDVCLLEWNGVNETMTKVGSGTSVFCYKDKTPTDGTNYTYRVFANDTGGQMNVSTTMIFRENDEPSITSAAITPDPAYTTNDLTCTASGWSDSDSDSAQYYYDWYNGSQYMYSVLTSSATHVLKSGNTTKGETWNCTVTPYDGYENGTPKWDTQAISNSLPTISDVYVYAQYNFTLDDLSCNGTYSDDDGDPESGSTYRWFTNRTGTFEQIAGETGKTMGSDITNETESYVCEYTPRDGSVSGTAVNSSALPIAPLESTASYSGTFTESENMTIGGSGTLNLGSSTVTAGNVTIEGTLTGGSGSHTWGSLLAASGSTYTATSGTTTVKGTWNSTGATFTHSSGIVEFTGFSADATLDGDPTFDNVEFDNSGYTITTYRFDADTMNVTSGTITLSGAGPNDIGSSGMNYTQTGGTLNNAAGNDYIAVSTINITGGTFTPHWLSYYDNVNISGGTITGGVFQAKGANQTFWTSQTIDSTFYVNGHTNLTLLSDVFLNNNLVLLYNNNATLKLNGYNLTTTGNVQVTQYYGSAQIEQQRILTSSGSTLQAGNLYVGFGNTGDGINSQVGTPNTDWNLLVTGDMTINGKSEGKVYLPTSSGSANISGDVTVVNSSALLDGTANGEYYFGTLTVDSGATYDATNGVTHVSGNWNTSAGTYTHNSGTVNITATATVTHKDSYTEPFYSLWMAASGTTTTMGSSFWVYGDLNLGQGTLTDGASSYTLTYSGGASNDYTDADGTLTIDKFRYRGGDTGVVSRDYTGVTTLHIYPNTARTYTLEGDISCNDLDIWGNFAGNTTLDAGGHEIACIGDVTVGHSSTFSQEGLLQGRTQPMAFGSLTIYSNSTYNATSSTTTLTSETSGGYAIDNDGGFINNNGEVKVNTSTSTSIDINGTSGYLYDLTVDTSSVANIVAPDSAFNLDNDLRITSGTFDNGQLYHNITGNFWKTGGRYQMDNTLDRMYVTGNFTVSGGDVSLTNNGDIYTDGNVTISGDSSFDPTSVYFHHQGNTNTTISMTGANNEIITYWYIRKGTNNAVTLLTDVDSGHVIHQEGILDLNGNTLDTRSYVYYGYSGATLVMGPGAVLDVGSVGGGSYSPFYAQSGWKGHMTGGTINVSGSIHATYGTVHFASGSDFRPTGGTFVLDATNYDAQIQVLETTNFNFYNLEINRNGRKVTLHNNTMPITNNLEVAAGTLEIADGIDVPVSGDLTVGDALNITEDSNLTVQGTTELQDNAIYLFNGTATNLTINGTKAVYDGHDVTIYPRYTTPSDPAGGSNIGKYVNMTNTSPTADVLLNVSYTSGDLGSVTESQLEMWKYNTSWYKVQSTGVVTAKDYVWGNITSFSIFAPLDANYVPTHDNPVLNATDHPLNRTTANLTCWNQSTADSDGDNITNIYNWYKDGSPIMVLNMPFDPYNSTSAKDYSGYGNDGTIAGSPSDVPGKVGRGLELDSVDNRMTVAHDDSLNPASLTIEAWVNLNDINDRHILITKWYGYSIEIKNATAKPYLRLRDITPTDLVSNTSITWGEWHHIAASFDNDTKIRKIYVDGVVTGSETVSGSITYQNNVLAIPYSSATWSNGTIDDVRIYNSAMSDEFIERRYLSTKDGYSNNDFITSNETSEGEQWTCEVTPSDGTSTGTPLNSSTLTILNSPPSVSSVIVDDDVASPANEIDLAGGTTKGVQCNGTVTDPDGPGDISSVTGRVYTSPATSTCTGNNRDCYYDAACSDMGSDLYRCDFSFQFNAKNTTGLGWTCNITTSDESDSGYGTDTTDVNKLLAIGTPVSIDFGALSPGATSPTDINATIENYGNVRIDTALNGSAMTCVGGAAGSIQVGNIRYDCDSYGTSYGSMDQLSTSSTAANCLNFDLEKNTTTTTMAPTAVTDELPWKIQVPTGIGGDCSGTIWFVAQVG